jgi:hypothetical protein
LAFGIALVAHAAAQHAAEQRDMALVGHDDLQARSAYQPTIHHIPATTANTDRRCVGQGVNERCRVAIQSNNVDVDDRGYIYVVDRANTAMHIVELTGGARRVANF